MKKLSLLLLLGFSMLLWTPISSEVPSSTPAGAVAPAKQELPEFNQLVLKLAREYPADGTHTYWWPKASEGNYDGSSADVYFHGVKIMKGEPQKRTFCCGFTMEVFVKAYGIYLHEHNLEAKIPDDKWSNFKAVWFVEKVNGPGPSAALEKYGLGRTIKMEEALPGDFVQIWRRWDKATKKNGSGHSVIFLEWVKDDAGKITGMKYLSTQKSTNGIGENIEYFGDESAGDGIAAEFTFYGRVEIPAANS